MKRLLLSLCALVGVAWSGCSILPAASTSAVIRVVLEHNAKEAISYLPAIDGFKNAAPGQASFPDGSVFYSYKAVSTSPGHYSVEGHYDFTQNGGKTKVDKMLHVYEKKPEQAQWFQISSGWRAYAFITHEYDKP